MQSIRILCYLNHFQMNFLFLNFLPNFFYFVFLKNICLFLLPRNLLLTYYFLYLNIIITIQCIYLLLAYSNYIILFILIPITYYLYYSVYILISLNKINNRSSLLLMENLIISSITNTNTTEYSFMWLMDILLYQDTMYPLCILCLVYIYCCDSF